MQEPPMLSERTALLIVDMQNAFFEDPLLRRHRDALVRNCNRLVAWARNLGMPIFNVRTEHARDKSTWTLSMLDDDQGFLFAGSDQAKNLDDLDIGDATEIIKRRDSAFWRTDLDGQLERLGVESVLIAGVSSHTCIAATAADAYAANIRASLVSDAIASEDPRFESAVLGLLQAEYRQKVVSVESLLAAANGKADRETPVTSQHTRPRNGMKSERSMT